MRSGEALQIPQAERYSTADWLHNLRTMPSSRLLKRIRNVVAVNFLWSCIVCAGHAVLKFSSPGSRSHSLLGGALGLLLVFRTNTAYNRFWEGRKIWEKVLTTLRDLGRMTVLYSDIIKVVGLERILHLLCVFPIVLQEHVQGFRNTRQLSQFLSVEDLHAIDRVTNRPYFVINKISQELKLIPESLAFTSRERMTMLKYVDVLSSTIGACERIVQTPVPLTYARHTSRFLSLFCLSMPIAVVGELEFFTIPFVTFVSWALFGILEIGMVIEEPFQRALKLEVFANTIRRDLSDMIHISGICPSSVSGQIQSSVMGYRAPFSSRVEAVNKLAHEMALTPTQLAKEIERLNKSEFFFEAQSHSL